jgi:hypothetical protein
LKAVLEFSMLLTLQPSHNLLTDDLVFIPLTCTGHNRWTIKDVCAGFKVCTNEAIEFHLVAVTPFVVLENDRMTLLEPWQLQKGCDRRA